SLLFHIFQIKETQIDAPEVNFKAIFRNGDIHFHLSAIILIHDKSLTPIEHNMSTVIYWNNLQVQKRANTPPSHKIYYKRLWAAIQRHTSEIKRNMVFVFVEIPKTGTISIRIPTSLFLQEQEKGRIQIMTKIVDDATLALYYTAKNKEMKTEVNLWLGTLYKGNGGGVKVYKDATT
ncbi:hypothetical protein ACJX0J_021137, partial [Zea mays]